MFPAWRLRLREARVACRSGRYDDAAALVTADSLREYLPVRRLAQDLAGKLIERAGDRFALGDSLGGWQDLAAADRLGGRADEVQRLRRRYADRILEEVQHFLAGGQTEPAIAQLEKLRKRGLADERTRLVRQIAQLAQQAAHAAAHGRFAEATAASDRAAGLAKPQVPGDDTMEEIANRLAAEGRRWDAQAADGQRLTAEMHAALAADNWSAALAAADGLLAIAPKHVAAGQARRRAWRAVGMDVTQAYTGRRPAGGVLLALNYVGGRGGGRSTHRSARACEDDTVAGHEQIERALLWVDAVGGYLVCLDDAIALGQPSPGERVAVPILADLSRRHAVIRRDAGAYILEPLQRTSVNGQRITGPYVLSDNDLIELGDNVRVRFSKSHALSATARLTIESHHKTQPSADAVLLMADSCVLGPNRHCHVRCRNWQRDVVIFRNESRLFCRADESLLLDGSPASNESEIRSGVRVEGEEFSFTWETIV